jgi:hypothetical protein
MSSNKEVAQLWANNEPGVGSNLYSDGKTLRSYNMEIGWTEANGEKTVVCNSESPSVSTNRHISLAARAISGQ